MQNIGPYRVIKELGRGGMGVVYQVQAPNGQTYALKLMLEFNHEQGQRFQREIHALRVLSQHQRIVTLVDANQEQGRPYLVMDFIEGQNLEDLLGKGLIDKNEAAGLLVDMARALHFVHEAGFIHRDFKPANVLVAADGVPYLSDFGIAKNRQDDSLTRTGTMVGTPAYMPPEQVDGKSSELDRRADVYSLGAVLYEILAERPPYSGSTLNIVKSILIDMPPAPGKIAKDVNPELEALALKALNKEPEDRPASAEEFASALDRILRGGRLEETQLDSVSVEATPAAAQRSLVVTATAALLSLTLGVAFGFFGARSTASREQQLQVTTEQVWAQLSKGQALTAKQLKQLPELTDPPKPWTKDDLKTIHWLVADQQDRLKELFSKAQSEKSLTGPEALIMAEIHCQRGDYHEAYKLWRSTDCQWPWNRNAAELWRDHADRLRIAGQPALTARALIRLSQCPSIQSGTYPERAFILLDAARWHWPSVEDERLLTAPILLKAGLGIYQDLKAEQPPTPQLILNAQECLLLALTLEPTLDWGEREISILERGQKLFKGTDNQALAYALEPWREISRKMPGFTYTYAKVLLEGKTDPKGRLFYDLHSGDPSSWRLNQVGPTENAVSMVLSISNHRDYIDAAQRVRAFRHFLLMQPKKSYFWHHVGMGYAGMGRMDLATTLMKRGYKISKNLRILRYLSHVYQDDCDFSLAIKALREEIFQGKKTKMDPFWPRWFLAQNLVRSNSKENWKEAHEIIEELYEIDKSNTKKPLHNSRNAYDTRRRLAIKLKRHSEKQKWADKALSCKRL